MIKICVPQKKSSGEGYLLTGTRGILLQLNGQFASQEIQLKFRLFTLFTVHVQRIRTTYPATNIKIHNELLVITYITGASEKKYCYDKSKQFNVHSSSI